MQNVEGKVLCEDDHCVKAKKPKSQQNVTAANRRHLFCEPRKTVKGSEYLTKMLTCFRYKILSTPFEASCVLVISSVIKRKCVASF